MMKKKINWADIIPIISFVAIFVFFTIASHGSMLSTYNLSIILDQSMITIIVGCGVLFVIAQGSTDMTIGVNLGLAGVLSVHVALAIGHPWAMLPLACIFGTIVGFINGVLVAKCKVPSFMLSIAELIGIRGLINYIQTVISAEYITNEMRVLNTPRVKIPMFIVIVVIMIYIFEFTRVGRSCRAIGENETTAKFVGIPVDRMKIIAFTLSGLCAGYASILAVAQINGTNMQMGVFLEMKTVMAIFFGGVLVTGGASAKVYKVFLGALSIQIIINGLGLIGKSATQIQQFVEGVLLLLVLFITMMVSRGRKIKPKELEEEEQAAA